MSAPIETVVRARSETEAAWMLAEGREGTRVIAGGTDLMLHIDRGRAAPHALVDVRRAGMDRLQLTDQALHIGATATASALSRWSALMEHAYGLWEAAATLSVPQIRNLATLGGNLANASPAADMVPPVLAMEGVLEIRRGDEVRKLSALQLATGPGKTRLLPDELVTNVMIPRWRPGSFHWFTKLGFRDAQIIAVCSLALSCELEGDVVRRVGIALGSVAPTCVRARTVEEFLVGQRLTRAVGEEAMRLLQEDISPIDDVRSQAAFRLKVAQSYLGDALGRAYLHTKGQIPDERALRFLKDPAPRPPSMRAARTTPLDDVGTGPARPLRIVATSKEAFEVRAPKRPPAKKKSAAKKSAAKKKAPTKESAAKKKAPTKKSATKKSATKKSATKKTAQKKGVATKAAAKRSSKKSGKRPAKTTAAKKKPSTRKKR